MSAPFFKTQFNHDLEAESNKHMVVPVGESLTVQSMAEDADINVLMRRYGITGKMPENVRLPQYGDYSHITSFGDAINAVRAAELEFLTIPADVRARFQNDPQVFLDFCSDQANMPELVKLGLAKERVPPPPPASPPPEVKS